MVTTTSHQKLPAAWVETLAAVFGMAGALAVAIPGAQGWGFSLFLVSNGGWLAFSAGHGHWKLFVQQWVFTPCSLLGLWNWWLSPLLG
jgi:nicotinamide riboside transporter PnuC